MAWMIGTSSVANAPGSQALASAMRLPAASTVVTTASTPAARRRSSTLASSPSVSIVRSE